MYAVFPVRKAFLRAIERDFDSMVCLLVQLGSLFKGVQQRTTLSVLSENKATSEGSLFSRHAGRENADAKASSADMCDSVVEKHDICIDQQQLPVYFSLLAALAGGKGCNALRQVFCDPHVCVLRTTDQLCTLGPIEVLVHDLFGRDCSLSHALEVVPEDCLYKFHVGVGQPLGYWRNPSQQIASCSMQSPLTASCVCSTS